MRTSSRLTAGALLAHGARTIDTLDPDPDRGSRVRVGINELLVRPAGGDQE